MTLFHITTTNRTNGRPLTLVFEHEAADVHELRSHVTADAFLVGTEHWTSDRGGAQRTHARTTILNSAQILRASVYTQHNPIPAITPVCAEAPAAIPTTLAAAVIIAAGMTLAITANLLMGAA